MQLAVGSTDLNTGSVLSALLRHPRGLDRLCLLGSVDLLRNQPMPPMVTFAVLAIRQRRARVYS